MLWILVNGMYGYEGKQGGYHKLNVNPGHTYPALKTHAEHSAHKPCVYGQQ